MTLGPLETLQEIEDRLVTLNAWVRQALKLPPPPPPSGHGAWGAPEVVKIMNYTGRTEDPYITSDEKYLLFDNAGSPMGPVSCHYAKMVDYKTFAYVGPIQGIGPEGGAAPVIDDLGNLYFLSGRSYPQDGASIWRGKFVDGVVTGLVSVPSLHKPEAGCMNMGACPSRGGALVVATDNCPPGTSRIFIAWKKEGGTFVRFANSDEIMVNVNNVRGKADFSYVPSLSDDTLEIFFTAPGTIDTIWTARRPTVTDPFGVAVPMIMNPGLDHGLAEGCGISKDGKHFYFHRESMGETKLYVLGRT